MTTNELENDLSSYIKNLPFITTNSKNKLNELKINNNCFILNSNLKNYWTK